MLLVTHVIPIVVKDAVYGIILRCAGVAINVKPPFFGPEFLKNWALEDTLEVTEDIQQPSLE